MALLYYFQKFRKVEVLVLKNAYLVRYFTFVVLQAWFTRNNICQIWINISTIHYFLNDILYCQCAH